MLIIKKGLKSLTTLKPLHGLAAQCTQVDGSYHKHYWHILSNRRSDDHAADFLAYSNNQLIAALHYYIFDDVVELSANVRPNYRQKGIFKKLLARSLELFQALPISTIRINCNEKNITSNDILNKWGGELNNSVIELQAERFLPLHNKQNIQLSAATVDDIPSIISMNQLSFSLLPNDEINERLKLALNDKNRQIFIARNSSEESIGKIHVRHESNRIVLHDFTVLPHFQGKGIGKSILLQCLEYYRMSSLPIIVEVQQTNAAALALYKSCQFIETNRHHFYDFYFADLLAIGQS